MGVINFRRRGRKLVKSEHGGVIAGIKEVIRCNTVNRDRAVSVLKVFRKYPVKYKGKHPLQQTFSSNHMSLLVPSSIPSGTLDSARL